MGTRRRVFTAVIVAMAVLVSGTVVFPVVGGNAPEAAAQGVPGGLPTPSGRITYVREGDLFTAAADGSDEQLLLDGPYNWPAEIYTDGQIRNPRWSPDGSMVAFERMVIGEDGPSSGSEVHVVLADGSGEQQVTELLECTPPPAWLPDATCDQGGFEVWGWTPRGDGLVVSGGLLSMFDRRLIVPVDKDDVDDGFDECVEAIHYEAWRPDSWFLAGVDYLGRWVGQLDEDRWSDSPQQLQIRTADAAGCDGARYPWEASWGHPVLSKAVETRSIDNWDPWTTNNRVEGVFSRNGTLFVHQTRASFSQDWDPGQLPEGVGFQVDVESFVGEPTRRLDLPLSASGLMRWGSGSSSFVVPGCDFSFPSPGCGLWSVDVETGAMALLVDGELAWGHDDGTVGLEYDVQCVPGACVPPPPCGEGMTRVGFFCVGDFDADGVPDALDNCPDDPNPDQLDSDLDGEGDICDIPEPDMDADGVPDILDNCPEISNADQFDSDDDGVGDPCDDLPEDPSNAPPCALQYTSVGYRAELLNSFPLAQSLEGAFCGNGEKAIVKQPFVSNASIPLVPGGYASAVFDTMVSVLAIDRSVKSNGPVEVAGLPDGSLRVTASARFEACFNIVPGGWGKWVTKGIRLLGNHAGKVARWAEKALENAAKRAGNAEVDIDALSQLVKFVVSVADLTNVCVPVWQPRLGLLLKPDGSVVDISSTLRTGFKYTAAGGIGVDPTQMAGPAGFASAQAFAAQATSAGDGIYMVGTELDPGLYRAASPTPACTWFRLSGLEDSIDDVIANDATTHPAIVEVAPGDLAFETYGCGTWELLGPEPVTGSPTDPFSDGPYRVGTDISPGVWATAGGDPLCAWERRSGWGGTEADAIEEGGSNWPQTVVIEPTDAAFASWNCGTWTKVTPSVSGFSPLEGVVGDTVTIQGVGLASISGVSFNGSPATTFGQSAAGVLTAVVPPGATSGPISVTMPGGDVQSSGSFTVGAAPNQAPTVTVVAPEAFATVRGPVVLRAEATDPETSVARVEFYIDGALVGEVTTPDGEGLWSLDWNSIAVSAGQVHSVSAIAYDTEDLASEQTGLLVTVLRASPSDYDGDGDTDRAVFRPETGAWYVDGQPTTWFGLPGDIPVPADYDGDATTDRAVFRAGAWYIEGVGEPTYFGLPGDVPVPGDYDGDGSAELAVFRPEVGGWYIDGQAPVFYGLPGDIPVPGDYDGDGDVEPAVWRPDHGGWYVLGMPTVYVGLAGDIPVPSDYDRDGAVEPTIWRPPVGGWYFFTRLPTFVGLSTDLPVPGDYDGDGYSDAAVWRPESGGWHVELAGTTYLGLPSDIPVAIPPGTRALLGLG